MTNLIRYVGPIPYILNLYKGIYIIHNYTCNYVKLQDGYKYPPFYRNHEIIDI